MDLKKVYRVWLEVILKGGDGTPSIQIWTVGQYWGEGADRYGSVQNPTSWGLINPEGAKNASRQKLSHRCIKIIN